MLTVEQMLSSTNDITNIEDISIELYKKFFTEILCNRVFIYTTTEDYKIKLVFTEKDFMHVLGAQHILGRKYKSTKFNNQVDDGSMTFETLNNRNSIQFKDDLKRYFAFSNIYHILTNCEVIYFDKNIYENAVSPKRNSDMDFEYILFQDMYRKKVHLGLDTFNKGRTYFAKSLLVTSDRNEKYIKNQKSICISNIKILDKNTNEMIDNIAISEVATTK